MKARGERVGKDDQRRTSRGERKPGIMASEILRGRGCFKKRVVVPLRDSTVKSDKNRIKRCSLFLTI